MSYSHIRLEHASEGEGWDGIATLTFNRPDKLNALNSEVLDELEDALLLSERNESIGGLILTGAGEKAFVAGADIKEIAALTGPQARRFSLRGQSVFRRLETMGKPTLAAINGYALGGGLELALSCTLRVASKSARLGLPELTLGLIPGFGGTQRLPRLIGRAKALEMILTGNPVDADEALRLGLVNRVAEPDDLLAACRDLLRKILDNGPLAVSLALEAVNTGLSAGIEEGLRLEAASFGVAACSEDKNEGTRAFLEKRPPVFLGR